MNELPILLDEYRRSEWAYCYCRDVKNDPKIREFITEPCWIYHYCKFIKYDPEMSKRIRMVRNE